jgi:hypothetical protein
MCDIAHNQQTKAAVGVTISYRYKNAEYINCAEV